ncbi:hypothetical protein B0H63DRAFT_519012 [Podospora didyma]|uniref:Uncharacterized protein n=1 Tax=Podospora didyma TaxID=330526 RepID=A0AAE0NXT2_9PEZI|nr:hypothetical protein B0H63DRAFT_519012 [Podospora didyma]
MKFSSAILLAVQLLSVSAIPTAEESVPEGVSLVQALSPKEASPLEVAAACRYGNCDGCLSNYGSCKVCDRGDSPSACITCIVFCASYCGC